MIKNTKLSLSVALLMVTSLSAVAQPGNPSPANPSANSPGVLSTPIIVSRGVTLGDDELTKYTHLNAQAKGLAQREAAGASKKTKIILGVTAGVILTGVVIWAYIESQYAQLFATTP